MSDSRLGGNPAGSTLDVIIALWGRAFTTVRRTPRLLALSVVLGIALWVFVTEDEDPSIAGVFPSQIPVTFVNVGQDLAVANNLGTVDLRIEASEERWESLTAANFEASVNLAGLTAREQSVPVRVDVTGTRGVRILAVEPPAITVNLEQVVSRIIPVEPRLLGAPPSGFEIVQTVPERVTVEILGPESLVELAERAVAEINVTGITVGFQQVAELVPRGASEGRIRGLSVHPSTVSVRVDVQKSTVSKTVPFTVELLGEPASGYRVAGVTVTPSVARIEGTLEVLQDMEQIRLGFVRLDGADRDIRVSLVGAVRRGVTATDGASARVVVAIEPVLGSTVLTVVPETNGVPDDLVADLGDQVVTVELEGPLPLLNSLEPGDVRAEVDVGEIDAEAADLDGEAVEVDAEVVVVAPRNITIREWRPASLSVTLTPLPTGDEG
ncbi:MAG: CdaR family protein [Chloroflexi bacterium]|nr:CdaR family protein [Chloroflexota bacterium]